MFVYIIPATTVLLSFLALLTSTRFLFSRQGLYWIFPVMMSLLFFLNNLSILLALAEADITSFSYSFKNFYPFVMALLWYLMITVFHYALKKHVADNRFENDSRKNRKEAEYLEKYERRRIRRESKRQKGASSLLDALQIPESGGEDVD